MNSVLWLVVIAGCVWGLYERRRILTRLDALESRSRETSPGVSATPTAPAPRSAPAPPSWGAAPLGLPFPDVETRSAPRTERPAATPPPAFARPTPGPAPPVPAHRWPKINLPAVLGVVISLLGFAFLLKLAIDQGWLRLSIESRHGAVALAGAGLVGLGWRLRHGPRAYSRTLLGGGVATLCLTAFSAVLVFDLIAPAIGFTLLLAIIGGAGLLATRLDSKTLAVIGLVGGLSAPVVLMNGPVPLAGVITYHAVFALAVLALATRHDWRFLEGLAFVGTFGCAALWTMHAAATKTMPGVGFDVSVFALAILWVGVALAGPGRRRGRFAGLVERGILLGTPSATLALFALGASSGDALAWRSFAIGTAYLLGAAVLDRTPLADATRRHLLASAGIAFVALAVPLGLEGEWITVAWATGAALQGWVATRGRRWGYATAAIGILALASAYHGMELLFSDLFRLSARFVDGTYLSGLWLSAAALLVAWWTERVAPPEIRWTRLARVPLALGVVAWLATHAEQIVRWTDGYTTIGWLLTLAAGTALLAERARWPTARALATGLAPAVLLLLGGTILTTTHPLTDVGAWAWPLALVVLAWVAHTTRGDRRALLIWTLGVTTPAVALWEVHHLVDVRADGSWAIAAVLASLAAWVTFAVRRWDASDTVRRYVRPTYLAALLVLLAAALFRDGAVPPWTYVAVLNPLDLATCTALLALVRASTADERRGPFGTTLAVATWACLTAIVLRAVHHHGEVPFELRALWRSMTAQAALTVTWAAAGLSAMATGALRARRNVWLVGAGVMAVVVAKLFAVDLDGVNTAARIVSFLGVGAFLLVVGYVAPVPPTSAAGPSHGRG